MPIAIAPILILVLLVTVLIAGAVLIVAGFRGLALWSSPYCVKCRYDLRGRVPEQTTQCPECGADLSHPKAVGFLRQGRRPKLIWLGVVVLISPILLAVALATAMYFLARSGTVVGPIGPHNLAQQSTPAVLAHVQNNPDQPWGWNELASRIRAGNLSAADAEQALQGLINHMTSQKPNGWDQPMHWQTDFLKAGHQAGLFSDQAEFDLADAFYGKTPTLNPLPRIRPGDTSLVAEIEFGGHWLLSQNGGMPIELIWAVDSISINGEQVAFDSRNEGGYAVTVEVQLPPLTPGDHDLQVTLDAAYVDAQLLVGFMLRNADRADWPRARRRWKATANATLTVFGENDQPVALSTDPALDPGPDGITVKHLVVQPERGQKRVTLELEIKDGHIGALSCDVALDLVGERRDLGGMFFIGEPNSRHYSGMSHTFVLDSLDPSITTADVTLTPSPGHVFQHSQVTEVWGELITLEDVPVQRYDLHGGENH